MDGTEKKQMVQIKGGEVSKMDDLVAEEVRLSIKVNKQDVVSLLCTPLMVRELVVGLLMTEGVAEGICTERMGITYGEEITVEVDAEGEVKTGGLSVTSGCVGGVTAAGKKVSSASEDSFSLDAAKVHEIFRMFQERSELYRKTGCVHSAAISDGEGIVCFAEDIGRHNAVDKVLGWCLLEGVDFRGKVMLASGRLSSEMVSKCARWGIPVVASRTAPTALAIEIALRSGITVVGFVRGERMNVYTRPERITG